MKNVLILIFMICANMILAQPFKQTSRLDNVTVYRSMARESRSSSAHIKPGHSDVVISGLSLKLIDASLQVSVKGEATLLSATVRTNYFVDGEIPINDPKSNSLRDSLNVLNVELRWIDEEKIIHQGEVELINDLLKSNDGKESTAAADLSVKADFYRSRITEIRRKMFDLALREEKLILRRDVFQAQLNEMGSRRSQPEKEIVLSFYAEKEEDLQLHCGFLVKGAGWIPAYDIHVESTSKPVDLTYKAKIFQNTGFDWKNVKISVSTTNPGLENNRPLMAAKYVDYVSYNVAYESVINENNFMQMDRSTNLALALPILTPTTEADIAPSIDPMEKDIQLDFDVAIRQNIPSDGKEHVCKLTSYQVPATYRYHAVPKIDPAAFLLARITDYSRYNLLKGDANVFFGDTYVGEIHVNPHIVSDTLLISLGRDERIVVKRLRIEDKESKRKFGEVVKDTYAYQTTIRNNKNIPIEIEVLDQIPLSRKKEIKVELEDKSGAEYNETFGKLMWRFTVKPNDSQKLNLVYTVEYPEGHNVEEL